MRGSNYTRLQRDYGAQYGVVIYTAPRARQYPALSGTVRGKENDVADNWCNLYWTIKIKRRLLQLTASNERMRKTKN